MRQAKIGAIFLVSIIALAGVGAGYAAWRDTIFINGYINTGSVYLDVIDYSGTWVWKDLNTDECVVLHNPNVAPSINSILVASAWAQPMLDDTGEPIDDWHEMHFDNLFPCIVFTADIKMQYTGTIPVKIEFLSWGWYGEDVTLPDGTVVDWLDYLWSLGEIQYTYYIEQVDGDQIPVEEGFQLHEGDIIYLEVSIHIPQDVYFDLNDDGEDEPYMTDFLMGVSGSGICDIGVIQWNEWQPSPP
jgi:hypothetical protein